MKDIKFVLSLPCFQFCFASRDQCRAAEKGWLIAETSWAILPRKSINQGRHRGNWTSTQSWRQGRSRGRLQGTSGPSWQSQASHQKGSLVFSSFSRLTLRDWSSHWVEGCYEGQPVEHIQQGKQWRVSKSSTWPVEEGILGEGGFFRGAFLVDTRIFIWSRIPAYSANAIYLLDHFLKWMKLGKGKNWKTSWDWAVPS